MSVGSGGPKGLLRIHSRGPREQKINHFHFNFIHTPHNDSVTESVTFQSYGVKEPGTKHNIISVLGQFSGQIRAPCYPEVVKPQDNAELFPTWK